MQKRKTSFKEVVRIDNYDLDFNVRGHLVNSYDSLICM